MDPNVKQQWVEALRSGDYTQTTSNLRDDRGHCCLGVLCELHDQTLEHSSGWCGDDYDGETGTLPDRVTQWADLDLDDPLVNDTPLSKLNDDGWSFDQIANLIETNL